MSRYMIQCSTTTTYHLVVEAPNEAAVAAFYEGCDGSRFTPGEPGGWRLDDIYESHTDMEPDITVNEDGGPLDTEQPDATQTDGLHSGPVQGEG